MEASWSRQQMMKKRSKAGSPERDEQIRVFDVLRLNEAQYPFLKWVHASMNGLHTSSPRMAADRKRQGQRAGVSDICLPFPCSHETCVAVNARCRGAYIEMKVKPNKPTPEQVAFMDFVQSQGYMACVAYSADEALNAIENYATIKLRGRG